jgi:hypothetical protein
MIKIFSRKILAALVTVAMALTLVVSFGAPAFAAAEDADITVELYWEVFDTPYGYYGESDGPYEMVVAEGTTLKDAIDLNFGTYGEYGDWGVVWDPSYDVVTQAPIWYLWSFIGCDSTLDYQTATSYAGWDWTYTVNGNTPTFGDTLPDGSPHEKTMDQYILVNGDDIVLTYDYYVSNF